MSELKAGVIVTPHDEGMSFDRGSDAIAVTERETEFYLKSEADKVIAEKDQEIAELKQKLDDVNELIKTARQMLEDAKATAYTESVDAGMRERRLKRALWYMRGCFCGRSSEYFSGMASRCKIGQEDFYKEVSERARRYFKASNKCSAMVKELGGWGNGKA